MKPTHFSTAADFRKWLEQHHARASELWIAFFKKGSGKAGMTYSEAVDEALCFGWIDGIIKRLDAARFTHRFTPRKAVSTWSNLNIRRVERLTAAGKMHSAGLSSYAARTTGRTGIYSFESAQPKTLPAEFEQEFRKNTKAWSFFTAQPAGYQRTAIHRVMAPKHEATRQRWLTRLIAHSASGNRLGSFG
jgi:uncharacterized protein YdeI (YjbR/CyaY-like superfamily)